MAIATGWAAITASANTTPMKANTGMGCASGFGVERDKDGAYPGRYGVYVDPRDVRRRVNMELSGVQNFRTTHWAGSFGAYAGPGLPAP